ncbi:transporter [Halomarina litorea]|uniref:transporter n=1 Tax=Halomarina litorea TaxID=2961595 RepID=UPI0020C33250|nr:transporter [Halomarina sp. BCD28]
MANDEGAVLPAAAGVLAGAMAWAVGYGVTYLAAAGRVREQLEGLNTLVGLFGGGTLPTWKAVAWLYFNAHFVDVRLAAAGRSEAVNFVSRSTGNAPLLYLLPPLALVCTVALTMRVMDVRTLRAGVVGGAAALLGYGVAALAMASLSAHAFGTVVVSVGVVTAVALAGVGYPLVFGTLGGALSAQLRS